MSPGHDYPASLSNLSALSPRPTPHSLPTSFPPKHSLIHSPRPPTNHPFAWTTQLLPSSAPRDNGHATPTVPGPTPKPNYHLGTSGAGEGGIDLRLCLEISWAQEACFPLDIKGQEQIRDPQLSPSAEPLSHRSHPTAQSLGPGYWGRAGRQDGMDPASSSVL